jgi:hypothetical protein
VSGQSRAGTKARAEQLLTSSPEGKTAYLDADIRDPAKILGRAAETLDFSKPTAVLLIAVLHFVQDSDDPYGIVTTLMDAMPPGSYLAIVHGASDVGSTDMPEANGATSRKPRPGSMPAIASRSAGSATALSWPGRDW